LSSTNQTKQQKWIKGQVLTSSSSSSSSFCSLSRNSSAASKTTLIFSSTENTLPRVGFWYQLNKLDADHRLRDFVEADVLVSKKVSSCPFLLHSVDSQIVFEQPSSSTTMMTSENAFLLHAVEFCPGGSLLNLVHDRLEVVAGKVAASDSNSSSTPLLDSLLLPLPSVSRIIYELLKAAHHLHKSLKVVHNAINLHNVFLDAENHVKLGNFSFATSLISPQQQQQTQQQQNKVPMRDLTNNNNRTRSPSPVAAMKEKRNPSPSSIRRTSPTRSTSPLRNQPSRSLCRFCLSHPEDEVVSANNKISSSPIVIQNHIKESRDIFSIGVICFELLFGSAPCLKAVKNQPETSLAIKLINLREELMLSSSNNNSEQEWMLKHNELLCRFLLLSLSVLPLDRPRISDCLTMFENVLFSK
jgi:hypothetical protein